MLLQLSLEFTKCFQIEHIYDDEFPHTRLSLRFSNGTILQMSVCAGGGGASSHFMAGGRCECSDLHFPVGQTVWQASAQPSALEAQVLHAAVAPLLVQQPTQEQGED